MNEKRRVIKKHGDLVGRRLTPKKAIGELQTLIGQAKHAYLNDRDPERHAHVLEPLDRAFDICVQVRSRWKPD